MQPKNSVVVNYLEKECSLIKMLKRGFEKVKSPRGLAHFFFSTSATAETTANCFPAGVSDCLIVLFFSWHFAFPRPCWLGGGDDQNLDLYAYETRLP